MTKSSSNLFKIEVVKKKQTPKVAYGHGQHGFRKSAQKILAGKHQIVFSGDTFESEHAIGYDVLARFDELGKAGKFERGKSPKAKVLENKAAAYQEQKIFHRAHIGTGNIGSIEIDPLTNKPYEEWLTNYERNNRGLFGSSVNRKIKRNEAEPETVIDRFGGFIAEEYRVTQRRLIEAGDVSSAVQINQLGYAFNRLFQAEPNSAARQAADESYDTMVGAMPDVTYAVSSDQFVTVAADPVARTVMYLARRAARTGEFPGIAEENAARDLFKLPPVASKSDMMDVDVFESSPSGKLPEVGKFDPGTLPKAPTTDIKLAAAEEESVVIKVVEAFF